jgi:hypothetical protein
MSKRFSLDFTPLGKGEFQAGHDSVQRHVAASKSASDFDLGGVEVTGSSGIDALFTRDPQMVTPTRKRAKVASLADLSGFTRLSADSLIHKSTRDLWAIRREEDGSLAIERVFDDNGSPLKG